MRKREGSVVSLAKNSLFPQDTFPLRLKGRGCPVKLIKKVEKW